MKSKVARARLVPLTLLSPCAEKHQPRACAVALLHCSRLLAAAAQVFFSLQPPLRATHAWRLQRRRRWWLRRRRRRCWRRRLRGCAACESQRSSKPCVFPWMPVARMLLRRPFLSRPLRPRCRLLRPRFRLRCSAAGSSRSAAACGASAPRCSHRCRSVQQQPCRRLTDCTRNSQLAKQAPLMTERSL